LSNRKAGTDHQTAVADRGDGNTGRIPLGNARKGRFERHVSDQSGKSIAPTP
jgi:hypothetical protein